MKRTVISKMPEFVSNLGRIVGEASPNVHSPEAKPFLDAFLGNRIQKTDQSGSLSISPLTGDFELSSPGGFSLSASPMQQRVEGRFKFGGPDTSIVSRDPKQALDKALGIRPDLQYGPEPMSAGRREMEKEIGEYLERNPYGYR